MALDILVVLCLLGACFLLTRFAKISIEITPLLVISSSIVFLYCFAWAGFLTLGAYLVLSFGGLAFFYTAYECCQRPSDIFSRYLTPGFVTWLLFTVVIAVAASSRQFVYGDELMHWAPHAKVMFAQHGFMTAQDTLFHKAYPPGARLFYYLFYSMGGYSEGRSLFAQVVLTLAPISLFAKDLAWAEWRKACVLVMVAFLIILLYGCRVGPIISLLMDRPVGVFFGGAIVLYLLSDRQAKDIILLIPVVFSLMLFKLKLLPLVLLLLLLILSDQLLTSFRHYRKRRIINAPAIIQTGAAILLVLLAALIAKYSWLVYLHFIGVSMEWSKPFTLGQVMVSFSNMASARDALTIAHFKDYLWNQSGVIIVLVLLAFVFPLGLRSAFDRLRWWSASVCLFVGLVGYLFGLLLLYLYVFEQFHGIMLASILRYSGIYFLAYTFFVLASFRAMLCDASVIFMRRAENITLIALIFICFMGVLSYYLNSYSDEVQHRTRAQLRAEVRKISDKVALLTPEDAKIFLVWQNTAGLQAVMLFYDLMPRVFNQKPVGFGAPYTQDKVWTRDISPAAFLSSIKAYDYLLLGHTDKQFWQRYGGLIHRSANNVAPLLSYQQCEGDQFNDVLATACTLKESKAYLFKIKQENGQLRLYNVENTRVN